MFGRLLNYEVKGQKILFQYEKMTTRIEVISDEIINVFAGLREDEHRSKAIDGDKTQDTEITVNDLYKEKGYELDIYIPSKKLAFEYQGLQHFQAVEHWGGKAKLEIQKEHDSRKKRVCEEEGIHLICINYDEELTNDYIRKRITLEGVD